MEYILISDRVHPHFSFPFSPWKCWHVSFLAGLPAGMRQLAWPPSPVWGCLSLGSHPVCPFSTFWSIDLSAVWPVFLHFLASRCCWDYCVSALFSSSRINSFKSILEFPSPSSFETHNALHALWPGQLHVFPCRVAPKLGFEHSQARIKLFRLLPQTLRYQTCC